VTSCNAASSSILFQCFNFIGRPYLNFGKNVGGGVTASGKGVVEWVKEVVAPFDQTLRAVRRCRPWETSEILDVKFDLGSA